MLLKNEIKIKSELFQDPDFFFFLFEDYHDESNIMIKI